MSSLLVSMLRFCSGYATVSSAPPISAAAQGTAPSRHVCVIGAGVAGLRCAQALSRAGVQVTVLEGDDGVGGRVRTDKVDGFLLDRGFQVFLSAYPESQVCLDYSALELCEFIPGAMVQMGSGAAARYLIADPSRRPSTLLQTLQFPVGSLLDKAKLVAFVLTLKFFRNLDAIFASGGERSTLELLRDDIGLDPPLIDSFFKPFFKGIFLAPLEEQSAVLFKFVIKMNVNGASALPKQGLGAVSEQLAQSVRDSGGDIRLSCAVDSIRAVRDSSSQEVVLADGSKVRCDAVVVATPRKESRRLIGGRLLAAEGAQATDGSQGGARSSSGSSGSGGSGGSGSDSWLDAENSEDDKVRVALGSACVYFALDHPPPVSEPILVLNGGKGGGGTSGVVNTVCFPSTVSASYAPAGQHLASVGVVGAAEVDLENLEAAVRSELGSWFGKDEIESWRHLRTYRIKNAQEARPPPYDADGFNRAPQVSKGIFVCGDHCATPSLNGALRSGRVAAEAILGHLT